MSKSLEGKEGNLNYPLLFCLNRPLGEKPEEMFNLKTLLMRFTCDVDDEHLQDKLLFSLR